MIRLALLCVLLALPAWAETVRVAQYHVELRGRGPGDVLARLRRGDDQVEAVARTIAEARPDVILLNGIDYDPDLILLNALIARIADYGHDLPHGFALPPNSGVPTGLDLNANNRTTDPEDMQGWARFRFADGMALLARHPLRLERDLTALLWRDLPNNALSQADPPLLSDDAADTLRLHPVGAWLVWLDTPDQPILLGTMQAQTPAFDGPEDRNGLRGRDELRRWRGLLDGQEGGLPDAPFILLGNANLDPFDGEGHHQAITALLTHPRLQDPAPTAAGGLALADPGHTGPAEQDTVDWGDRPGNLRVDYVLPSRAFTVEGSLLDWPTADDPRSDQITTASRHRLIAIDVTLE